ncbi:MAG: hypothetical protein L3J24_04820 [Xanthomonadales bacterium]|nr:hypothetical protein [Xanthomonadales bacterium]
MIINRLKVNRLKTNRLKASIFSLFFYLSLFSLHAHGQEHTLNLQDAEVQTLVATVSEITGRTFIMDPSVTGKVTVISNAPMDEKGIYAAFLSVLEVHGLAAVDNGNVIKIVPSLKAMQKGGHKSGSFADEIVTRVIAVKHIPPSELLSLLRPLLPPNAQLVAHDNARLLLVSDRAANVARVQKLVDRIDRSADENVEVIVLQHASAVSLATTLEKLYGSENPVIADSRTNTLLITGDKDFRMKTRALVSHLDTPLEDGGSSSVVYLQYASAVELVPLLENTVTTVDGESEKKMATIQAHEGTNALIITGSPAVVRSLMPVIRQLDIRRRQVQVEAIIAEVSESLVKELGVQWQSMQNLGGGEGIFGGTNFGTGGDNILGLASGFGNGVNPGTGLNLGYVSGTISILGEEIIGIGALLTALSTDSDTNVLSTPSIVSMDNAEAEIYVGQEVPFITGQYSNTGASDQDGIVNPFTTIERTEVGIRLTVTPHINKGDSVILDISQELSAISSVVGAVDLVTNKRTLRTRVLVPDNSILVLGGLITDELRESIDAVPGLSKIPFLGELFKNRTTNTIKRNLMIFIRPRILDDDGVRISSEKYNYLRARQIESRRTSDGLTPQEQMPLLPELTDYLQAPLPEYTAEGG